MNNQMEARIEAFTNVARIPVAYAFGPSGGYGYEVVKTKVEVRTVEERRYGSDSDYGFAGGFLFGSML